MIFVRLLFLIYFTHATYLYFDRRSYEIFLSEATSVYTKIAFVKAVSSPSLSIQYELHGDTNQTFYLNSLTGEVMLLNSLDYETISLYKLTIEARSSSSVAPAYSELIIHVINVNDNPPDINLIVYPSVLYESNIIRYDLGAFSTPFATINIKDYDDSTKNLTLHLNDTTHFQIQLIKHYKNELSYILSTKNNSQLVHQDNYYLSLISCDNDQPTLCTNHTYKFHMKSNEYLCNLSFNQNTYIIDIKDSTPIHTLLMHKITNRFCQNISFSIDDEKSFYIDASTGDLFTLKRFNRVEQSVYVLHLSINNHNKINLIIRILDQSGHVPFLLQKNVTTDVNQFSSIHLFNSSLCRSQTLFDNYFQVLPNCTIITVVKPPIGQYLFNIELEQPINYQDTFLLELRNEQEHVLTFQRSNRVIIIPTILSILFALGMIGGFILIIFKKNQYKFDQLCPGKKKMPSYSINSTNERDKSLSNKPGGRSNASQLKVYDDHEVSLSPKNPPVYSGDKLSPPRASLSPVRDDEGYSGSSNVSENPPVQLETTLASPHELSEQYHVHQFPARSPPCYDVPRRYSGKMGTLSIAPNVSMV